MAKTRKTRNVFKNKFKSIERVWAENGVIRVEDSKGKIISMDVSSALFRAQQLNNMLGAEGVPNDVRDHTLGLVEKIVMSCKEARHQSESPSNKKTEALSNAMKGLTLEGKNPDDVESEDQKIARYQFMFSTLEDKEISTVLRESSLTAMQKEYMMRQIHSNRIAEFSKTED